MRPASQTYQAVIFDMDGVIVDSEPRHKQAFHEVVRHLGFEGDHGIQFDDYVGRRDHDLWIDFVAKHRPAQSLAELLTLKRDRVLAILQREKPIFAGLPELVERLARHVPLALASGSERPIVEVVLGFAGLRSHFEVTVSGSDIVHGKPNPEIFLKTAMQLGVAPETCWVIEDSKPGVAAALAANMRVIAITNTHPAVELQSATAVVSSYEEIGRLLLGA